MDKKPNLIKTFLIIFAVTILLEATVFNFRFYQSLFYKDGERVSLTYSLDKVKPLGDNTFKLKADRAEIEFSNINQKVNNFYLDMGIVDTEKREKQKVEVVPYITDEANTLYKRTEKRFVVHDVPLSQYLKFNTSGVSEKIKFEINAKKDDVLKIYDTGINVTRPFDFSIARVFVVFLVLSVFFGLKAPYVLKFKLQEGLNEQTVFIVALVILQVLFMLHLTTRSIAWQDWVASWHEQYKQLAVAMVDEGQLYLSEEPPQALIDMENPYDTNYRDQIMQENGTSVAWDRAYYDGHYYVYFGLVPVATLFIPYYMMTGEDLPNHVAVFIYLALFAVSSFALIWEIIRKWFKDTPFVYYILFSFLFVNCTNMLMTSQSPGIYEIPITGAVAFTVTGLYFWISSLKKEKVIWWRILIGSLSMALVAGCRPQLLLMSFTAIMLFWNTAFKDRLLFSKKGALNTVALVLPYVVVAAVLMWYNNARFGSPFDFGANYNLTTNDMTHRGIVFDRVFSGIFYGLFQPPEIITTFPFVKDTHFASNYLGTTITQANFGGFISCNILVYIIFFVRKFKDGLKEKGLYIFTIYTIISAFIINFADTQGAGILQRYICDYGILFMLATIIILLCLIEKTKSSPLENMVYKFILGGAALSFAYNLLLINTENSLAISNHNIPLYYDIYHTVQFWL